MRMRFRAISSLAIATFLMGCTAEPLFPWTKVEPKLDYIMVGGTGQSTGTSFLFELKAYHSRKTPLRFDWKASKGTIDKPTEARIIWRPVRADGSPEEPGLAYITAQILNDEFALVDEKFAEFRIAPDGNASLLKQLSAKGNFVLKPL